MLGVDEDGKKGKDSADMRKVARKTREHYIKTLKTFSFERESREDFRKTLSTHLQAFS